MVPYVIYRGQTGHLIQLARLELRPGKIVFFGEDTCFELQFQDQEKIAGYFQKALAEIAEGKKGHSIRIILVEQGPGVGEFLFLGISYPLSLKYS